MGCGAPAGPGGAPICRWADPECPNPDGLTLRLEDPDTLFFNRRLLIEGDTDLGLRVKNMLDGVELEAAARAMPAGIGRVVLSLRALAAD